MLRKAPALTVAENITPNRTTMNNNGRSIGSNTKTGTTLDRTRVGDIWISQLLCNKSTSGGKNIKKVCNRSPVQIVRITIIFLLIVIVLRIRQRSWLRRYRFMMWNDTGSENYQLNSLSSPRLISVAKAIISTNHMFESYYHQYERGQPTKLDTAVGEYIVRCNVTTDVRGNLGPASVLIQNQTTDWIKDRWQAASDMHGTNIHGPHYVQLDWSYVMDVVNGQEVKLRGSVTATDAIPKNGVMNVIIRRIVLDWEAAYSDNYDIQIWTDGAIGADRWMSIFTMRPIKTNTKKLPQRDGNTTDVPKFDANGGIVTSTEWGQSPGVTFPTPLHIVHDIELRANTQPSDILLSSKMRIVIHTSAMGWGVSLWQVQVYGCYGRPSL